LAEKHNQRFFSYLSLFTWFMIILVTSENLLLMFVGWEGVGICSYLLVNFWYTRIAANQSSISALLTNRVGDCFLTIGMFGILWSFGKNTKMFKVFLAFFVGRPLDWVKKKNTIILPYRQVRWNSNSGERIHNLAPYLAGLISLLNTYFKVKTLGLISNYLFRFYFSLLSLFIMIKFDLIQISTIYSFLCYFNYCSVSPFLLNMVPVLHKKSRKKMLLVQI